MIQLPPEGQTRRTLDTLLNDVDRVLGINNEGNVTFNDVRYFESLVSTVLRHLNVSDQIPDAKKFAFTRQALLNSKRSGDLSCFQFERELRTTCRNYIKQPLKKFSVLSRVAIETPFGSRPYRFVVPGGRIFIARRYPKYVKQLQFFLGGSGDVGVSEPASYACLWCIVHERDAYDAADRALDCVNEFLAILNFANNYLGDRYWSYLGPYNVARLGPEQIIVDEKGRTVTEFVVRQTNYIKEPHPLKLAELARRRQKLLAVLATASKAGFRFAAVKRSLLQYHDALNEADWYVVMIKLWAALEMILLARDEKSKVAISRGAAAFADREKIRRILEVIAETRNTIVHHGRSNENIDNLALMLKRVVERHLANILFHRVRIGTHEEYIRMLDNRRPVAELQKEIAFIRRLIRLNARSSRVA